MSYVPQFPCYKVYKKANHALQIVWFENESSSGHFSRDCAGGFLIQFLEMDLTDYANALSGFIKDGEFNFRLQFDIGYRGVCDKLREAADLVSDNIYLHRFLIADIERCFAKEEWSDPEQLENAFMVLGIVLELQEQFKFGISFCLDDGLFAVEKTRKFHAFMQLHPKFRDYTFQTGYALMPVDKLGNLDYDTVRQVNDQERNIDEQLATLQKDNSGMSLLPFTWILSFEDLLFYDFLELLSSGLRAKRCKLCGRYFVQRTRHKTEYCDRKTENGRTCKQVGPKILFNAELAKPENATLKEYDRIRKAKQQKLERDRNKESGRAVGKAQAAYDKWSEMAAVLRERFIKGEISDEELLTEIN